MKKNIMLMAMMMLSSLIFAQQKTDRPAMAEKQAQKMKTELSLNEEQTAMIQEINKTFFSHQVQLLADTAKTRESKMLERKRMQDERNSRIKGVLTEEQFALWNTNKENQNSSKQLNKKQGRDKRAGVKNEMDELKVELNLSDDQYKKMMAINTGMTGRMKAMRTDSTISRVNFRQEIIKLKEEKDAAVKSVLNEDQYVKFVAYETEKFKNRRRGGAMNQDKHKKG